MLWFCLRNSIFSKKWHDMNSLLAPIKLLSHLLEFFVRYLCFKQWLNQNGIQNWVPTQQVSGEKFSAFIVLQNGLVDWAELKRIARSDGINIETQIIAGNQIFVKIPLNYRSKFTALVHEYGWKYTDNGGVLQVWR